MKKKSASKEPKLSKQKQIQEYISKSLNSIYQKAKEYLSKFDKKLGKFSIKKISGDCLIIKVPVGFFSKDERIILPKDGFYEFEWNALCTEKYKKVKFTFSTHFDVKEDQIRNVSADNLTIFDSFTEALGINDLYDKSANFSATYLEGETYINNTCELIWDKTEIIK